MGDCNLDLLRLESHTKTNDFLEEISSHGRSHGLAVAIWITDHYPCSNLVVGISVGCFIFDLASLTLEVARPI